jgi:hypothetical protein
VNDETFSTSSSDVAPADFVADLRRLLAELKALPPAPVRIKCNANAYGKVVDWARRIAIHEAAGYPSGTIYNALPIDVSPDVPLDGCRATIIFSDGHEEYIVV